MQYVHSCIGINGRLDAIQAAVLNVKLKYYNNEIEMRQKIAARYSDELNSVKVPIIKDGFVSV